MWHILPIGGWYATYHLLWEPETTIDFGPLSLHLNAFHPDADPVEAAAARCAFVVSRNNRTSNLWRPHEPRKTTTTRYFPWNTLPMFLENKHQQNRKIIIGLTWILLIMVYHNPHITGLDFIPNITQPTRVLNTDGLFCCESFQAVSGHVSQSVHTFCVLFRKSTFVKSGRVTFGHRVFFFFRVFDVYSKLNPLSFTTLHVQIGPEHKKQTGHFSLTPLQNHEWNNEKDTKTHICQIRVVSSHPFWKRHRMDSPNIS